MDEVTMQETVVAMAMGKLKVTRNAGDRIEDICASVCLGEIDEGAADFTLWLHWGLWEIIYAPKNKTLKGGQKGISLMALPAYGYELSEVVTMLGYALTNFSSWNFTVD